MIKRLAHEGKLERVKASYKLSKTTRVAQKKKSSSKKKPTRSFFAKKVFRKKALNTKHYFSKKSAATISTSIRPAAKTSNTN